MRLAAKTDRKTLAAAALHLAVTIRMPSPAACLLLAMPSFVPPSRAGRKDERGSTGTETGECRHDR